MPTSAVVVDVWVKAGAKREPAEWSGMAHFLEHMVFKGTHRIGPGEFDWAIESQGGMTNAATSHDYAHFYITVAADALAQTLPYLADLLLYAAIPADEFDRERNVVLEEIRQAHDDPDWIGYQTMCELLYGAHPYGRAVLGTPESLEARSPEEMRRFHQAHYQPENMVVAIAGGISQARAVELIQQSFDTFPQPVWCPEVQISALEANQPHRRELLALPNLEQGRLTMAWTAPGVDDIETASGLDLLSVLLGGGRTSWLVSELREEKQLVQDIDASFSMQAACSLLSVSAWLENEQVREVEDKVCDRIHQLHTQPISPSELTRCQRLLLNDYAFSTEAPGQITGLYGYYATIASPELGSTYPNHLQRHTPESLQHLAKQYLSPERYTAVELKPA